MSTSMFFFYHESEASKLIAYNLTNTKIEIKFFFLFPETNQNIKNTKAAMTTQANKTTITTATIARTMTMRRNQSIHQIISIKKRKKQTIVQKTMKMMMNKTRTTKTLMKRNRPISDIKLFLTIMMKTMATQI